MKEIRIDITRIVIAIAIITALAGYTVAFMAFVAPVLNGVGTSFPTILAGIVGLVFGGISNLGVAQIADEVTNHRMTQCVVLTQSQNQTLSVRLLAVKHQQITKQP